MKSDDEKQGGRGEAILIVGGCDATCAVVVRDLKGLGHQVVHVETAADADHVLKEQNVVFIVQHLFLPDRDGRQFLAEVCENPASSHIPIVVIAPEGTPREMRDEGLFSNVAGHLEEPLESGMVLKLAAKRLRRTRKTQQGAWRDPITGLPNRAGFLRQIGDMASTASLRTEPCALALLSVEGCGPGLNGVDADAGRDMMREVAGRLSKGFRATDLVARWSAAEFAVAFPGEGVEGAIRALEKVFASAGESVPGLEDRPVALDFCAGVVALSRDEACDASIERAQEYLFHSQTSGGARRIVSRLNEPEDGPQDAVLLMVRDHLTSHIMTRLLEKHGFHTVCVRAREEAEQSISSMPPFRLIVLDETLCPNEDFTLLRWLREGGKTRRCPVLMVMAGHAQDCVMHALEAGANDYVVRPFPPGGFILRVRRLLSRGMAAGASVRMHRVLIVDDDLKQLVAVGSAFYQRGGFQVYMALGARDGLDRLQQVEPEVLILAGRDLPDEAEAPLWKGLAGARGLGFDPLVVVAAEKKRVEDLRAAAGETISEFIDYPPKLSYIAAGVERLLGASSGGKRHRDASSRFNEEVSRLLRTTLESPA